MSDQSEKSQSKESTFPSWEPEPGISIRSLHGPESIDSFASIIPFSGNSKWSILQTFQVDENELLHLALNQGLAEIELNLDKGNEEELNEIMAGVNPEMIVLHLNYRSGPTMVNGFYSFKSFLAKKNIDIQLVKGSFRCPGIQPFPYLAMDIAEQLPGFSFYYLETTQRKEQNGYSDQLASIFRPLLLLLEGGHFDVKTILKKTVFRVFVENDFVADLAKIRSFYRIWNLITDELELPDIDPYLEVSISPSAFGEDLYFNLIRSSAAALSAITAGAPRVHIPTKITRQKNAPSDPAAFLSRMHVNIGHLLEHESHLDKVKDPAAGSYLIEELTEKLAAEAWAKIRKGL